MDLNATQAAIRAGYSSRTAAVTGAQLLRNPKVRSEIDAAIARRSERTEITADRVLQELARIGLSDVRAIFDEQGALRPMSEWPDDVARAVASVEVVEMPGGEGVSGGLLKKIKLWDKPRALELVGKHLGMFVDKLEVKGKLTLEELVLGSMEEGDGGGE